LAGGVTRVFGFRNHWLIVGVSFIDGLLPNNSVLPCIPGMSVKDEVVEREASVMRHKMCDSCSDHVRFERMQLYHGI
jgi:hypothetical protein